MDYHSAVDLWSAHRADRQALIDEEERAQRAADAEADNRARRSDHVIGIGAFQQPELAIASEPHTAERLSECRGDPRGRGGSV